MLSEFIRALMRPQHYMELRAIHLKRGVVGRQFTQNPTDVEKFSLRHGRDAEIYMGVAPRIRNGDAGLKNCASPTALWVDADDLRSARAELALFDLEPSITVRSGRGLHLYSLLRDEVSDWDLVKRVLRKLADRLGGDAKSAEPAHILRVPGTMNHKYSPPRPVEIEQMDLGIKYDLAEIVRAVGTTQVPIVRSAAFLKARAWMTELPGAVQGEHGDDATYQAACMLVRDFGLDEEDAFTLLWEWNERCVPPWTHEELMKKLKGAEAYGQGQKGEKDPVADFEGFEEDDFLGEGKPKSLMEQITEEFKSVDENGKFKAYAHRPDEILGRRYWVKYDWVNFLRVCDAVMHYGDVKIKSGDKIKSMPAGQYWLTKYKNKTTYRGIVYAPEYEGDKTPDGRLNIWTGFAVQPKSSGSWELLKKLTLENLCGSDVTSYEYVMNWMARAIQRPWEPGAVALVFKGPKGTGKSTLGTAFMKLFGQHGMHITSPNLLTGRFNAHAEILES